MTHALALALALLAQGPTPASDHPHAGPCRWPGPLGRGVILTWNADDCTLPGLTPEQVHGAFCKAWRAWSDVANIVAVEVPKGAPCHVWMRSGAIDGRGTVAAWSNYPCQPSRPNQVHQVYDVADRWSEAKLFNVARHELGHCLGLPHADGTAMDPFCDQAPLELTPVDDMEIIFRYGGAPAR